MRVLTILFSLVFAFAAVADSKDQITFNNEADKQAYLKLLKELRCPKCQNQNIADSNAVVAKDMRVKTKELIDQGYNEQQVIDYMVDRYGQFAHYQPPLNVATVFLWLLPALFLVIGVVYLTRRGSKPRPTTDIKQLDKELEQLLDNSDDSKGS